MPSIALPVSLRGQLLSGTRTFSPASLFSANEPGVWFDPSDLTTLFQDPAGTTPVTTPGNTVGLMLDKSKGLVLGAELVANGDFSSGTGWTLGTGVSISGGSANWSAATSYGLYRAGVAGVSAGNYYEVTFTVSNYVSGTIRVYLGSVPNLGPTISANGTYTTRLGVTGSGEIGFFAPSGAPFTGSIDNFSVKALAGNHATQATLAARPTYSIEPVGGRRNLLTFSEDQTNAIWSKSLVTVTANAILAPDGISTTDTIIPSTANDFHYLNFAATVASTTSYVVSFYAKNGGYGFIRYYDGTNNAVYTLSGAGAITDNSGGASTITSVGDGWYRCTKTVVTASTTQNISIYPQNVVGMVPYTGNGTSGVFLWGAQLELGSTATAYQRVTTQHDVTEAGVASLGYLYFDGVNDAMVTSTITPGTDKAQVFAGVRKVSDAAIGTLLETGIDVSSASYPGSLALFAPSGAGVASYQTFFRGAVGRNFEPITTFAAPVSNVVTFSLSNQLPAAGDAIQSRANGVAVTATESSNITTAGNFGNWPMYLGGRAGTSLFFVGHLYSLITRFGPTLDAPTIASTEVWVAGKTGFYTPIITGVPTIGVS